MTSEGRFSKVARLQAQWRLLLDRIKKIRHDLTARSGGGQAASAGPSESGADSSAMVFSTANLHLVFGMNWVPAQPDQRRSIREQARKTGMRSHVELDSLVGVSSLPAKSKKHPRLVSGALMLSEGASMGGNEIFVIDLEPDLFALVALQDSLPVPGFDLIGSQEMIKSAADNFLRLPHRSAVRRCGSREIITDAEFFNFQSILEDSDYAALRLKALTDHSKLIQQLMILTILAGVATGVYVYIDQRNRAEEAARLLRENDPDVLYEKSFSLAQGKIPPLGRTSLSAMLETAKSIPLSVRGWVLTQVKCTPELCTAQWSRQYGSYVDFSSKLPVDVKKVPDYSFLGKSDSTAPLTTEHPVEAISAGEHLGQMRQRLPLKTQVQMDFVSQMQDYSLVKLNGTVSAPTLFGGSGEIGAIFRPVLAGEWTVSGELWQLEELEVPDYAVVDSFQINQLDQVSKKSNPTFSLSGRYFVKGKDFR